MVVMIVITKKIDEEYKESRCVHCPHCDRLIERTSGCHLMKCGKDYHGNGTIHGCGKEFDINKAKKYKSAGITKRKVAPLDVTKPKFQEKRHELMPGGVYFTCDECSKEIVGPRFECIHCPIYNICALCESKLIKSNLDEAPCKFFSGEGEGKVKELSISNHNEDGFQNHVFRIHIG